MNNFLEKAIRELISLRGKNISNKEFAKEFHISTKTLERWKKGGDISGQFVLRLLKALPIAAVDRLLQQRLKTSASSLDKKLKRILDWVLSHNATDFHINGSPEGNVLDIGCNKNTIKFPEQYATSWFYEMVESLDDYCSLSDPVLSGRTIIDKLDFELSFAFIREPQRLKAVFRIRKIVPKTLHDCINREQLEQVLLEPNFVLVEDPVQTIIKKCTGCRVFDIVDENSLSEAISTYLVKNCLVVGTIKDNYSVDLKNKYLKYICKVKKDKFELFGIKAGKIVKFREDFI